MKTTLPDVGNTPLVHLPSLSPPGHQGIRVFAKLEQLNPTGSLKDRLVRHILHRARQEGQLDNITTIVEASSGNTATSVAFFAAYMGLKSVIFVPEKTSEEKVRLTRMFGASVQRIPAERDYMAAARQYAQEHPEAYWVNQYDNKENTRAHYDGLGREILRNMAGKKIDAFVAAGSTGGTISGIGRRLKENDGSTQVVLVDPRHSIYHDAYYAQQGPPDFSGESAIEGIGKKTIPGNMDFGVVDRVMRVEDREAVGMVLDLEEREAVFVGGSSGANALAAWKIACEMAACGREDANILTVFPDGGKKYVSKFRSPEWLAALTP